MFWRGVAVGAPLQGLADLYAGSPGVLPRAGLGPGLWPSRGASPQDDLEAGSGEEVVPGYAGGVPAEGLAVGVGAVPSDGGRWHGLARVAGG